MRASAAHLPDWLRRFARWFFTASPDPVDPPSPAAKPKRQDSPRLKAQNAGRVNVAKQGKPS